MHHKYFELFAAQGYCVLSQLLILYLIVLGAIVKIDNGKVKKKSVLAVIKCMNFVSKQIKKVSN